MYSCRGAGLVGLGASVDFCIYVLSHIFLSAASANVYHITVYSTGLNCVAPRVESGPERAKLFVVYLSIQDVEQCAVMAMNIVAAATCIDWTETKNVSHARKAASACGYCCLSPPASACMHTVALTPEADTHADTPEPSCVREPQRIPGSLRELG
jgi:hypothetical protein